MSPLLEDSRAGWLDQPTRLNDRTLLHLDGLHRDAVRNKGERLEKATGKDDPRPRSGYRSVLCLDMKVKESHFVATPSDGLETIKHSPFLVGPSLMRIKEPSVLLS